MGELFMRTLTIVLFLLMLAFSAIADESGCPADRASREGHAAFGEFHHVLAPVCLTERRLASVAGDRPDESTSSPLAQ